MLWLQNCFRKGKHWPFKSHILNDKRVIVLMPFIPFLILPTFSKEDIRLRERPLLYGYFYWFMFYLFLDNVQSHRNVIFICFISHSSKSFWACLQGLQKGRVRESFQNKTAVRRKTGFLGCSCEFYLHCSLLSLHFLCNALFSPQDTVLHTSCSPFMIYTSHCIYKAHRSYIFMGGYGNISMAVSQGHQT